MMFRCLVGMTMALIRHFQFDGLVLLWISSACARKRHNAAVSPIGPYNGRDESVTMFGNGLNVALTLLEYFLFNLHLKATNPCWDKEVILLVFNTKCENGCY